MTYADALKMGYKVKSAMAFQSGYVSRKNFVKENAVCHKPGGMYKNRDMLYILVPCYFSTRYCWRLYLEK